MRQAFGDIVAEVPADRLDRTFHGWCTVIGNGDSNDAKIFLRRREDSL